MAMRSMWLLAFLFLTLPVSGLSNARQSLAEEAEGSEQATTEGNGEGTADDETDPLAVPKGDAKEIVAHVQKLWTMDSVGNSKKEKLRHQSLIFSAVADAATHGLTSDLSDEDAKLLASARLNALRQVKQLAEHEFNSALKETMSDQRTPVASAGWWMNSIHTVEGWNKLSDDGKAAFKESLLSELSADSSDAAARASGIRTAVGELAGQDPVFANDLLERGLALLANNEDETVKNAVKQLEGIHRRMNLMGNELELHGPLLGGEELDWASYRGKVVLVDFWATWCGPCIAEIPNVKEQYEAYHEKGFDVVGISLDDSPEKVEKFLADREVPWPTLFGGPAGEDDLGWNQPMARHYGISGIPTAILVDQEGRVVSMRARGPVLKEELQKLLGDSEPKPASENDADEEGQNDKGEE